MNRAVVAYIKALAVVAAWGLIVLIIAVPVYLHETPNNLPFHLNVLVALFQGVMGSVLLMLVTFLVVRLAQWFRS